MRWAVLVHVLWIGVALMLLANTCEGIATPPPSVGTSTVTAVSPTATLQPEHCKTAMASTAASDLFSGINDERVAAGQTTLAWDARVAFVAQERSDDMAARKYFAHVSPTGDTAFSLMDACGIAYGWAGENLARNNYPEEEQVAVSLRDLMASSGHRENILSPNYTRVGIAAAWDESGMVYFTMIFIGPP